MLGVGVIGCGHWGRNHIRVFNEIAGARVVAACDLDTHALASVGRQHPQVLLWRDVQGLLSDPRVEAVVIATGAASHHAIAMEAIARGRHVLVEKPFTLAAEEGEEIIERAAAAGVTLMVGHTFLYNSAVRRMKEYMASDRFGTCYYLQATRTHLGLIRNDVNALWDLAPHDIAIFNYLLGAEPLAASAVGATFLREGNEDIAFVTLSYPEGVVANMRVSWVDSHKVREVVAVGSRQRIVFDDLNNLERLKIFEKGAGVERPVNSYGEFQNLLRDGDIISPKVEMVEPLRALATEFVACVESGARPMADGENGVEVVRVLNAIQESMRLHGAPVGVGGRIPQVVPVARVAS